MLEKLREYLVGELVGVFDDEAVAILIPADGAVTGRILFNLNNREDLTLTIS